MLNVFGGFNSFRVKNTFSSAIKTVSTFRKATYISSIFLFLLLLATLFPLSFKSATPAEGATKNPQASTLTFNSTGGSASATLEVSSASGSFATSSSNASFSIETNNATGYTLNLKTSDSTTVLSDGNNHTIASINDTKTSSNFTNNSWGLLPSKYNGTNNTTNYYPADNVGFTMDTTSSSNTGTPNTYTVGLGLKADYTIPAGTYTNATVIAEYIANPITYAIYYYTNTTDTVTGMPANNPQVPASSFPGTTATSTTLASAPTRTGYTFLGWCAGTSNASNITVGTNGATDTCSTITYDAGQSFGINATGSSSDNYYLYAMWSLKSVAVTVNFAGSGVTGVTFTNASYGSQSVSTSGGTANLKYGVQYTIAGTYTTGYEFDSWSATAGTLGSTSSASTTYSTTTTGAITLTGKSSGLIINYDGDGGYFNNDPSNMINSVIYNATRTFGPITKYAHTSNINDAGVASGTYPIGSIGTSNIVRIPGATSLNVTLSYSIEENWDYLYVFTGEYNGTITGAQNAPMDAGQTYTFTGGTGTSSGSNSTSFSITGDTATFAFWSDPGTAYYGYYATITANGYTYSKTAISGSYAIPNKSSSTFLGWSESSSASNIKYTNETEISSGIERINGDSPVTLYAQYCNTVSGTMQAFAPTANSCISGTLTDSRDNQIYTVEKIKGAWWMTRNLAIGCNGSGTTYGSNFTSRSLTSSDSNVNSTWSTPTLSLDKSDNTTGCTASDTSGCNSYTDARIKCSSTYGAWYNYAAASAGTIVGDSDSTVANYSVCPKGWRLPKYGNTTTPGTVESLREYAAFTPIYNNKYYSGSLQTYSGHGGEWWGASAGSDTFRSYLYINSRGTIGPGNDRRDYGFSIRCVHT